MKSINLKNVLIICAVSAVLGVLYNTFSANGIPLVREHKSLSWASDSSISETTGNSLSFEPKAITLSQAYKFYVEGKAKFIDARDKWDFGDGHIQNAVNIPEYNFEPSSPKVKYLKKDQLYILYCGSDDCELSQRLASELNKLGFKNIYVFLDGYEVWLQNGYPVEMEAVNE